MITKTLNNAFTLAEVLITLVIIGVVAALTIPSLIIRTEQQQYKTGALKAASVISQAMTLARVEDGVDFNERIPEDETNQIDKFYFMDKLAKHMNIVKKSGRWYYTADGMAYSYGNTTRWGHFDIIVDVNGDKGPNTSQTDSTNCITSSCKNGGSLWNCGIYDLNNINNWDKLKLVDVFIIYSGYSNNSATSPTPLPSCSEYYE